MFVLAGCGAVRTLSGRLGAQQVRVTLVNNGDFPVDVRIRYDDEQDIPEDLLDEVGTEVTFTVPEVGGTQTFARDCGEFQAFRIVRADLDVLGEVGPSADTVVQRDGDDFNCGDSITITFEHPQIPTELTVTIVR
jgi:hypothetical protein